MMNCEGELSPPDNPDDNTTYLNQLSKEDLEYWNSLLEGSRYTVQMILFPIAMIIGVIGNSITIAVLTRRHMKTSTNLYLTALAVSDLMYLTFAFSLSLKHIPGMSHANKWYYWQFYRYALWLVDGSSSTSTWLTVTFTIERYIAVCHPIKGKVFCTQSRAKRVIASVFMFCFLMTVTTPHEWVVVIKPGSNGTELIHANSCLWKNDTFKKAFSWVSAVMFHFLPIILLTTFNAFLVLAVKEGRKQRFSLTGNQPGKETHASQEYKITVMLIAVVIMAIVCLMPTAIMVIYFSFHELKPETTDYYATLILNNFFNFLTAINATTNFIFYCVLSDRYRKTFLKTFCSRWYEQQSPQLSWAGMTGYSNCEEGSPYSFSRTSTRRSRRRSSHRSSGSSSPRNSPSRASFKFPDRHFSRGETFLMVPTYGSTKRKKQSLDSSLGPIEDLNSFDRKSSPSRKLSFGAEVQELLPKEDSLGSDVPPFGDRARRPSREGSTSENESAVALPTARSRWWPLHARRFFALLRAKQSSRSNSRLHSRQRGQSIVITCQKPSFDQDQTSV